MGAFRMGKNRDWNTEQQLLVPEPPILGDVNRPVTRLEPIMLKNLPISYSFLNFLNFYPFILILLCQL